MHSPGMMRTTLATLVLLAFAAGPVRADDPKVLKVTGPGGAVIMNPTGVEVTTPGGKVTMKPGQVQVNTPGGVGAAADTDAGALRYTCGGNRTVTVANKVLTAADGVVFTASANCTLNLNNVVVSGHIILKASGNAEVKVRNCTFTGSSVAVDVSGNVALTMENTVVTAPAGLTAGGSSEVHLVDCTITAAETAIDARGMAVVNLVRTTTSGKRVRKGSAEINGK